MVAAGAGSGGPGTIPAQAMNDANMLSLVLDRISALEKNMAEMQQQITQVKIKTKFSCQFFSRVYL